VSEPVRPAARGMFLTNPLSRLRHSASHIMADAVQRLRPKAKVTIGPAIENGFYYDFDTEPFAPEDIERIEAEMAKIVAKTFPSFARSSRARKPSICSPRRGKPSRSKSSRASRKARRFRFTSTGDFVDLCAGPHIDRTGEIKAFKVLSFAGAYWRR